MKEIVRHTRTVHLRGWVTVKGTALLIVNGKAVAVIQDSQFDADQIEIRAIGGDVEVIFGEKPSQNYMGNFARFLLKALEFKGAKSLPDLLAHTSMLSWKARLTHVELSEMLGCTRVTVTRAMQQLEDKTDEL